MTTQPEALRLADYMEKDPRYHDASEWEKEAAAELRRLQADLEAMTECAKNHDAARTKHFLANQELLEALHLVQIDCQYLHHAKKDRHSLSEDCPVAARINASIAKHGGAA